MVKRWLIICNGDKVLNEKKDPSSLLVPLTRFLLLNYCLNFKYKYLSWTKQLPEIILFGPDTYFEITNLRDIIFYRKIISLLLKLNITFSNFQESQTIIKIIH